MVECYRCGVSEEKERLFGAISNKGVVKLCKRCANEDSLPLIQPVDLNKPEKVKTVYERLSTMANLDPVRHRRMLAELEREEAFKKQRGNVERMRRTTLKDVINTNLEKSKPQARKDLVPNYHWVIMRMRRSKKLTQKQLAENIGESEASIRAAEEGMLLSDTDVLVRKLESYFGTKLREGGENSNDGPKFINTERLSDPTRQALQERFDREGKSNSTANEDLAIEDLKDAKEKKKSGGLFSFFRRNKEEKSEQAEEATD